MLTSPVEPCRSEQKFADGDTTEQSILEEAT